jgi:hypothetical protein
MGVRLVSGQVSRYTCDRRQHLNGAFIEVCARGPDYAALPPPRGRSIAPSVHSVPRAFRAYGRRRSLSLWISPFQGGLGPVGLAARRDYRPTGIRGFGAPGLGVSAPEDEGARGPSSRAAPPRSWHAA